MNNLKIERLLLLFTVLLIIAMFLWPVLLRSDAWDFHLHDTYFIINTQPVIFFALLYCCFLFALYTILRNRIGGINAFMALFHIGATIGFTGFLLLGNFVSAVDGPPRPRRYLDISGWNSYSSYLSGYGKMLIVLLSLFLAAQLGFFIYFLVQILSRNRFKG